MHALLNPILQGDNTVKWLIAVMACTAIEWLFFYQVVDNNAYKHRKQREELVSQL